MWLVKCCVCLFEFDFHFWVHVCVTLLLKMLASLIVSCILLIFLPGFRSVPLRNEFSEELELASLLVHLEVRPSKVT